MADFNAINENLNSTTPATVSVNLVTLGGVNQLTVSYGQTIAEFKRANALGDAKVANGNGEILSDSAIITEDTELYISTPKRNG
jgi:hypothetical protein